MKKTYESKIQDLNNQLQQSKSSSNSQVPVFTKKVAVASPAVIEEPIFDKSDCAIDPKEKTYFKEIM